MSEESGESFERFLPERYRIERQLARGGMSRVYLAHESHPDRPVVIKVMDGRLSEEGRERFLREVNFTAKLSHPHIVPILAAGEAGSDLYYVMPFVEGETLAERVEREGGLPVAEAIQVALDVARALHYAHLNGVIHRDVKPGNILFQDGHALVADFGVARAHGEADADVTREGHTLGTVDYMAPEQATASKQIDGTADQYALACVLYEMLAGEPPFHGRTAQSTLARHLSDTVPSLLAVRETVGVEIEGVILRALQKTPVDRFRDMEEFADALGDAFASTPERLSRPGTTQGHRQLKKRRSPWIQVGVPTVLLLVLGLAFAPWRDGDGEALGVGLYRTSVAVLPPEGRTIGPADGTDTNALAEALANEISTALSRVPWLKVIPFYSVRAVQGANLSVPQLLDTLNVEHLLQGSLTLQGGRIVIQLGHVDDADRHEAGQQFSLDLEDWLDEQPRIAGEVAQKFVTDFGGDNSIAFTDLPAQSSGQRDFLIGNRFLGQRTPEGLRRAIDAYWTALEKDSTYAPAFAQLSSAYALAINYRYEMGMDEYSMAGLAEALASRATELNPNGAAGWASRSYLRALAGAPTVNAAADIDRARRLEPNNPSVPSWSARVHSLQGNHDEAFREAVRAAELDQLGSGRQFAVAYQAFHMGRYETAVEYADLALDLEPDLMLPRVVKARAFVLMELPEQCLSLELGPHDGARALCLWAMGDQRQAQQLVDSLEASYGSEAAGDFTRITRAEDLAVFYAYTGDAQQALRWIERAYEKSPTGIELRVLESELFDDARAETGFQVAVNRLRGDLWGRVLAAWEGPLVRPSSAR